MHHVGKIEPVGLVIYVPRHVGARAALGFGRGHGPAHVTDGGATLVGVGRFELGSVSSKMRATSVPAAALASASPRACRRRVRGGSRLCFLRSRIAGQFRLDLGEFALQVGLVLGAERGGLVGSVNRICRIGRGLLRLRGGRVVFDGGRGSSPGPVIRFQILHGHHVGGRGRVRLGRLVQAGFAAILGIRIKPGVRRRRRTIEGAIRLDLDSHRGRGGLVGRLRFVAQGVGHELREGVLDFESSPAGMSSSAIPAFVIRRRPEVVVIRSRRIGPGFVGHDAGSASTSAASPTAGACGADGMSGPGASFSEAVSGAGAAESPAASLPGGLLLRCGLCRRSRSLALGGDRVPGSNQSGVCGGGIVVHLERRVEIGHGGIEKGRVLLVIALGGLLRLSRCGHGADPAQLRGHAVIGVGIRRRGEAGAAAG